MVLTLALAAACLPPQPAPDFNPPAEHWWLDAVFYQVFVRSFYDSDGDGIGDFNGLIEKLDYLNDGDPATDTDLGVTGLWLMPIMPSPSYHGYDVVDYYGVNPDYGTLDDFERLLEEAHRRGIRVIIDMVLNHTGTGHPWFVESDAGNPEYRDWYIWSETAPNYRGPWSQVVWHRGREGYYYGVFWGGMPDLNLENPAVTAELFNTTRYWLEDVGVGGFRLDGMIHLIENGPVQENTLDTHAWLRGFRQHYKSISPDAFVVGEAWTHTQAAAEYVDDKVDLVFEFDLAESFVRAANGPIAVSASASLTHTLAHFPPGQFAAFLTNHDQNRVMSVLGGDTAKARLAAVMLLTSPGVPFIYYGEEIGMTGTKPDEDIRRPMQWEGTSPGVGFTTGQPWRAAASDYPEVNVAAQIGDPDSLLSTYRDLIGLRRAHAALRTGDTAMVDPGSGRLYAVLRYNELEAFLVLVNVGARPLPADQYALQLTEGPFSQAPGAEVVFSTATVAEPAAPTLNDAGGFENYQPLAEIPPQSAVIIRLRQ
jgi:alpha-amylase